MQVTIRELWLNMDLFKMGDGEYIPRFEYNGEKIWHFGYRNNENVFLLNWDSKKDTWKYILSGNELVEVEPKDFDEEIAELQDMKLRFNILFNKERLYK